MRAARVGGTFWAAPAAIDDAASIVCVEAVADAEARLVTAERTGAARPIALLLAESRAAHRVAARLRRQGVRALAGDHDPWSWARPGVTVHARATDERAFIALVAGANLVMPGVSRDEMLAQLARHLFDAASYRDPFANASTSIERVIEVLGDWRRQLDENRTIGAATGMAWWKRRRIDVFLWNGSPRKVRHAGSSSAAIRAARDRDGAIACWPSRAPPGLIEAAGKARVGVVRVEDGFLRSRGLGADLVPPLSVVIDPLGIYYDPAAASALEQILATARFSVSELDRADALIALIVREGVGKYSIGGGTAAIERGPRRTILVAGQVEDDLSWRLGAADLAGNLDLLRRARAVEPAAQLWYRPHPDVEAGHRNGAVSEAAALAVADRIVRGGDLPMLLDAVDGVHVATSLTGFEALLRGCDVTTHGQPFYAGWGLTRDLAAPIARRGRRLTLTELVAGTLIRYPRYLDPRTGLPCPPEVLLERLVTDVPATTLLTRLRRWQGHARRAMARVSG